MNTVEQVVSNNSQNCTQFRPGGQDYSRYFMCADLHDFQKNFIAKMRNSRQELSMCLEQDPITHDR